LGKKEVKFSLKMEWDTSKHARETWYM
jgi:hypothetical protein